MLEGTLCFQCLGTEFGHRPQDKILRVCLACWSCTGPTTRTIRRTTWRDMLAKSIASFTTRNEDCETAGHKLFTS